MIFKPTSGCFYSRTFSSIVNILNVFCLVPQMSFICTCTCMYALLRPMYGLILLNKLRNSSQITHDKTCLLIEFVYFCCTMRTPPGHLIVSWLVHTAVIPILLTCDWSASVLCVWQQEVASLATARLFRWLIWQYSWWVAIKSLWKKKCLNVFHTWVFQVVFFSLHAHIFPNYIGFGALVC